MLEPLDKRRRRFLTLGLWTSPAPGPSDAVISPQTQSHAGRQGNNSVTAINNESDNGARNYDSHNHNDVNRVSELAL